MPNALLPPKRFEPNEVEPVAADVKVGRGGGEVWLKFGAPLDSLIIEARKGFAAPPPVICGLRPCPTDEPLPTLALDPVKPELANEFAVGAVDPDELQDGPVGLETTLFPLTAAGGVPGEEPGIGGKDSSKEAPKDEDGLNGFNPANPVICGLTDVMDGEEEV